MFESMDFGAVLTAGGLAKLGQAAAREYGREVEHRVRLVRETANPARMKRAGFAGSAY